MKGSQIWSFHPFHLKIMINLKENVSVKQKDSKWHTSSHCQNETENVSRRIEDSVVIQKSYEVVSLKVYCASANVNVSFLKN